MASPERLLARLVSLLTPLGPASARRMFGGYGLYLEGTIFALLFDGTLFLKADEETRADFEERGLGPLTYEGRKGRTVALPYWEAPASLLKDGKALCRWAQKAHEAGLRFKARKARAQPQRPKAAASLSSRRPRAPRYKPDF